MLPRTQPELSVIIAVRDVEEVIGRDVRRIAAHLRAQGAAFEIVAVNDGCRDNSLTLLRLVANGIPELRLCLADASRRAFARGLVEARGRVLVLFDAREGSLPFGALAWALSRVRAGRCAVVLRGRCIVAHRETCLRALLGARGRGQQYERAFERSAASLPMEIFGSRNARRLPRLLAPVFRFLAA